jgi:hypothetical protein
MKGDPNRQGFREERAVGAAFSDLSDHVSEDDGQGGVVELSGRMERHGHRIVVEEASAHRCAHIDADQDSSRIVAPEVMHFDFDAGGE